MISLRACAAALAFAATATAVEAQQTTDRVDAKRDWSVFTSDEGEKVCWIVTQPTTSVARRGGKQVTVNRGPIYLMVAVRPAKAAKNEVSMVSGYPFKKGSTVAAKIGADKYDLFTEGEGAWLASSEDDDRVVASMKRGATAVMTGTSERGTVTIDTFSLLGFTAALESARTLCP